MRASASVVIVGAGIVGCTAAWHLARLGWRDVVVVEQGPFPQTGGSSSHAPGIVFQTASSKTLTGFARETVRHMATLDLDGEPCWYGAGSLEVAETPTRLADLQRKLGWARAWGVAGAALLSPAEAATRMPFLDPAAILGAYWVPSDGVAKAVHANEAMLRQVAGAVELIARTPVVGIETAAGRVTGVRTAAGTIATDRVLVCAGIWGPEIGRLAGVPIPLAAVEHQFLWTAPMPEFAGETRELAWPVLRHQDRDLYMRHRRDHFAVGSYAHDPKVVDSGAIRRHGQPDDWPASNPFDAAGFARAWEDAVRLLPFLQSAQPGEAFNGMFSFTPDGMPLLGESQLLRGFWTAEAIWITHSAGAAKAVAEWMSHGRADVDLRECDINRFEPHATTAAYIRERGGQQYREVYDVIHPLQPLAEPRPLRLTPFAAAQQELGAVTFEGRGWEQPRWYEANAPLLAEFQVAPRDGWSGRFWSPIATAEHLATRRNVALVDMSPLPKIEVSGPAAGSFLERMTTAKVARAVGAVTYALLLDERGTVRSDVTVARLAEDRFQLGANGPLDLVWLRRHAPEDGSVQVRDVTGALCCLGLWGPKARDVVERVSADDWSNVAFPYYSARQRTVGEVPVTALRVSYVGELGWELYCSPEYGLRLWRLLWNAGQPDGMVAAGRAAFDTLRLEKGYRLWGTDVYSEHTPDAAGLGFAIKPGKGEFLGRDAVLAATETPAACRLCCLALDDPSCVAMGKEPIWADGAVAGYVTSAGFAPSVGKSIAYGWLDADLATPGTAVDVELFGTRHPARVAEDPLFDPTGSRMRG
ncbi:MAG: FAD-dependent oxidoreductase [Chloroflexia bacterium]|nr:FAD-dependent oxidoreductase [Chloroflexia bacterium]